MKLLLGPSTTSCSNHATDEKRYFRRLIAERIIQQSISLITLPTLRPRWCCHHPSYQIRTVDKLGSALERNHEDLQQSRQHYLGEGGRRKSMLSLLTEGRKSINKITSLQIILDNAVAWQLVRLKIQEHHLPRLKLPLLFAGGSHFEERFQLRSIFLMKNR